VVKESFDIGTVVAAATKAEVVLCHIATGRISGVAAEVKRSLQALLLEAVDIRNPCMLVVAVTDRWADVGAGHRGSAQIDYTEAAVGVVVAV